MNISDPICPLPSIVKPIPPDSPKATLPDRAWHLDILIGNVAMAQGHQRTISIINMVGLPVAWRAAVAAAKATTSPRCWRIDVAIIARWSGSFGRSQCLWRSISNWRWCGCSISSRSLRSIVKRIVAVLPDNTCILIGDNATASTDSRQFGAIPFDRIIGKVTSRFSH